MTNSKKKTKYSEEEFSRIVDDVAIILQRKSDHVMNIKQVAEYRKHPIKYTLYF